jgi:uncharacterized protein DUF6458
MAADREVDDMGIGVSLFLLAIGAILAFAVDVTTEGFNLNTMGIILMIVGGVGLLFSMLFWGSWGPNRRDERVVTREREVL